MQTAAYNLPNDDRVVQQKGSKRVMLKNVQEAKFRSVLLPIARRTLSQSAMVDVSFEPFFTHILAHELMHGLGPHQIKVQGRDTTPREELKELYSAIEERKSRCDRALRSAVHDGSCQGDGVGKVTAFR